MEKLAGLLDSWLVGGDLRKPWCLLDLLGVDVRDGAYLIFVRSQVFLIHGALGRKWEQKFSGWRYILHQMVLGEWTDAETIEKLLAFGRKLWCCVHVFARSLKRRFSGRVDSDSCRRLLAATYDSHRLCTDWSDRAHVEVNATMPPRCA